MNKRLATANDHIQPRVRALINVTVYLKNEAVIGAGADNLVKVFGKNDALAIKELSNTVGRVKQINISKAAMSADKRAGFILEEVAAGTFNAAARKAGDSVTTASTGASNGLGTDPRVDISIRSGMRVLDEAQVKCCRSSGRTAAAISNPKYEGTTRLVPSDQALNVKQTLMEKSAQNAKSPNPAKNLKGHARQEAAAKTTDRLKANGIEGKPFTYNQTQDMALGDLRPLKTLITEGKTVSAIKNGAKAGAIIGGSI